jgi:hypothetical protein
MKTLRSLVTIAALAMSLSPALAQMNGGPLQNGTPLSPSVTGSDTSAGVYFGTGRVGVSGHLESANKGVTAPVASICGNTVDAGSTDNAGTITNAGLTTCSITFGTPFTAKPACTVTDNTTNRATMVATVSAAGIAVTGITAGDALSWICVGKTGG